MALAGLLKGQIGELAIRIAEAKASLGWTEALARGILCNMLVCLAVWLTFAARDVAGQDPGHPAADLGLRPARIRALDRQSLPDPRRLDGRGVGRMGWLPGQPGSGHHRQHHRRRGRGGPHVSPGLPAEAADGVSRRRVPASPRRRGPLRRRPASRGGYRAGAACVRRPGPLRPRLAHRPLSPWPATAPAAAGSSGLPTGSDPQRILRAQEAALLHVAAHCHGLRRCQPAGHHGGPGSGAGCGHGCRGCRGRRADRGFWRKFCGGCCWRSPSFSRGCSPWP